VVRILLVRTPDVRSAESHGNFRVEEEARNRTVSRALPGPTDSDPGLVFASFDVVVDDQREDYKYPHGEDAHSGDGFRNQTRQNHPSTAQDEKQEECRYQVNRPLHGWGNHRPEGKKVRDSRDQESSGLPFARGTLNGRQHLGGCQNSGILGRSSHDPGYRQLPFSNYRVTGTGESQAINARALLDEGAPGKARGPTLRALRCRRLSPA